MKREIPASFQTEKKNLSEKALYQIIFLLLFSNKLKEINNTTLEENSLGSKWKKRGLWT